MRQQLLLPFVLTSTCVWRTTRSLSINAPFSMHALAMRSVAGSDPNRPQKVNQDAYFVCSVLNKKAERGLLVGVMDGHGLKGHLLTKYLAQQLPQRVAEQLENPQPQTAWEGKMKELANFDIEQGGYGDDDGNDVTKINDTPYKSIHNALRNAFHQSHLDAIEAPDIPAGRSGTTCIACLIDDTHVHIGWVGDSRALQVCAADGSYHVLANETTVLNFPQDASRIAVGQGRIDVQGHVWYGPVGISMTRALGDAVMLRAGVVPTPLVRSVPYSNNDTLIIATDGIWDVLANQDVADLVAQTRKNGDDSVETLADLLVQQAQKNWIGDLPLIEEKVDDITCVIVRLQKLRFWIPGSDH